MKSLFFMPTRASLKILEKEIESFKLIEGMYIKTAEGLSPAAYYFPLDVKPELTQILKAFENAKLAEDNAMKLLYQLRNKLSKD